MRNMAAFVLDIQMKRFEQLLRTLAKEKGMDAFAIGLSYKDGMLFLSPGKISKLDRDNFEWAIETLYYEDLASGKILGRGQAITLHMIRIKDEQIFLLMKCHRPDIVGELFEYFVGNMESLQEMLAQPMPEMEQVPQEPAAYTVADESHQGHDIMPARDNVEKEETPTTWSPGDEPWMKIKDINWERQALELWWGGYTAKEIGDRLGLEAKTINNCMSRLRETYDEEIVPTVKQLRKMGQR